MAEEFHIAEIVANQWGAINHVEIINLNLFFVIHLFVYLSLSVGTFESFTSLLLLSIY